MTQYYISVYSDKYDTLGIDESEKVNNEIYDKISKALSPLHLDILLEYDHGFGDWYNWFQVSFTDDCNPSVLFPYLRELSLTADCSFCLVAVNDTQERWFFDNGRASEPEFATDEEPFPEIESVQEMIEEED